ncbi:Transcription initiation factor TFIID subunit 12 [Gaertneriomyces sp. JEL0708]|nr:Transcription initiation factor TFIID subunit 12 [Gaertneriomyces sp. JEL0708]
MSQQPTTGRGRGRGRGRAMSRTSSSTSVASVGRPPTVTNLASPVPSSTLPTTSTAANLLMATNGAAPPPFMLGNSLAQSAASASPALSAAAILQGAAQAGATNPATTYNPSHPQYHTYMAALQFYMQQYAVTGGSTGGSPVTSPHGSPGLKPTYPSLTQPIPTADHKINTATIPQTTPIRQGSITDQSRNAVPKGTFVPPRPGLITQPGLVTGPTSTASILTSPSLTLNPVSQRYTKGHSPSPLTVGAMSNAFQPQRSVNLIPSESSPTDMAPLVTKERVRQVVSQIDPSQVLENDVEELILELAGDFISRVAERACQLARHRGSDTVEVKDARLPLEMDWGIRVPGFGNETGEREESDSERDAIKNPEIIKEHQSRVTRVRNAIKHGKRPSQPTSGATKKAGSTKKETA